MFLSGDYVVPHRNGKPYVKKAPLFFWSVCLVGKIAGEVNEAVARIPSALAATALVLATFFWVRAELGPSAGLFSALVLATTFRFYWNARFIQTDMVFSFLTGAAIFALYTGTVHAGRPWLWCLVGYAAAGFAILAKGPLAVVLLFLALGPFLAWRQWKLREIPKPGQWMPHLVGIVLCLGIALPWYLLSVKAVGGSEFAQRNLVHENWTRFFNAYDHKNPWYKYLVLLPVDFLPWTVFLPAGFAVAWQERKKGGERRWLADFLFLWLGLTFVFFSLSQSKQGKYLLPLYPGFAPCVGWFLAGSLGQLGADRPNWGLTASLWGCLAVLFFGVIAANGVLYLGWPGMEADDIWLEDTRSMIAPLAPTSVLAVLGSIAGAVFLVRRQANRAFGSLCVTLVAVYLTVSTVGLPAGNRFKSARPLCETLRSLAAPEDRVAYAGPSTANDAYVYYSRRTLEEIEGDPKDMDGPARQLAESPGRAFLFIKDEDFEGLSEQTRRRWTLVERMQVGHRQMLLLCNDAGRSERR
jgi:4-amino-4-deoxy-L-arabinose transferase-like glycosyltransferase